MQFSPRLLKNWASASVKKYSKNYQKECQQLISLSFYNTASLHLVKEELRFLLPNRFCECTANLVLAARISYDSF